MSLTTTATLFSSFPASLRHADRPLYAFHLLYRFTGYIAHLVIIALLFFLSLKKKKISCYNSFSNVIVFIFLIDRTTLF